MRNLRTLEKHSHPGTTRSGTRSMIRMSSRLLLAALVVWCCTPSVAVALHPPRPGELERLAAEGTLQQHIDAAIALGNHKLDPGLAQEFALRNGFGPGQGGGELIRGGDAVLLRGTGNLPSIGTTNILVLTIEFPDDAIFNSPEVLTDALFDASLDTGRPGYPFDSLHNFYWRSSYGKLDIQGKVLGPYRTKSARSEVAVPGQSQPTEDNPSGIVDPLGIATERQKLVTEAMDYFDRKGEDFSQYDLNGDGMIDYMIVIWAGPLGNWSEFWWPCQPTFDPYLGEVPTYDGVQPYTYTWMGETDDPSGNSPFNWYSVATICHETGHALGLPDLYDYAPGVGPENGVGGFDMMDWNVYDYNGFWKWLLGWTNPTIVGAGYETQWQSPNSTSASAGIVLWPEAEVGTNVPYGEFYYIENRQPVTTDALLGVPLTQDQITDPDPDFQASAGEGGVVVWHVSGMWSSMLEGFLYNNSDTQFKLVKFVEAPDANNGIEAGQGVYSLESFFYPGQSIDSDSIPDTKTNRGHVTGVEMAVMERNGSELLVERGVQPVEGTSEGAPARTTRAGTATLGELYTLLAEQGALPFSVTPGAASRISLNGFRWNVGTAATAPAALAASALAPGEVSLHWTEVPGATGYVVERALSPDGTFSQTAEVTTPYYTDAGRSGTTYYYRVKANATGSTPSGTVAATTPEPATATAQEHATGVTYEGGWDEVTSPGYSGGTALRTVSSGAVATVPFRGSAVRLLGTKGPGFSTIDVTVDGEVVAQGVELSSETETYQEPIFTHTGLSTGPHTLTLTATGTGAVELDAIAVTGIAPGILSEEDAAEYEGGAKTATGGSYSGGSAKELSDSDASVAFSFRGTSVGWLGTRSVSSGKAKVYIDGVRLETVDVFAASTAEQALVWRAIGLEDKDHTLKIVPTGKSNAAATGSAIQVDAFVVW